MSKVRRILILSGTFVFVLGAYVVYNRIVDTPTIQVIEDEAGVDIEVPDFGSRTGEIGETIVGAAEQTRFTVLDPETKEPKHVFGFEKLLGPVEGEVRRKVINPYMEIYERNLRCKITSDYGMVRVETAAEVQSPKDARLYGHVKIHIQSGGTENPAESVIYLEDVSYNSERSEFTTDKTVRLESADVEMEGTGMVLIYNTRWGRLEYFKVVDLDELRFKNVRDLMPSDSEVAKSEPEIGSSQQQSVSQDVAAEAGLSVKEGEYYECRLSKDVVIEYGREIVVTSADDVTISNILWSGESLEEKQEKADEAAAVEPDEILSRDAGESNQVKSEGVSAGEDEETVTVTVKCRGGMVVEPIVSVMGPVSAGVSGVGRSLKLKEAPLYIKKTLSGELVLKNANLLGAAAEKNGGDSDKGGEVLRPVDLEESQGPVEFNAKRIDYDMSTGNAIATGPVEFTFYAEVDSNDLGSEAEVYPVVITAQRDAEFLVGEGGGIDRAIFNGDVVGVRSSGTAVYDQEDRFTGERLVVELDEGDKSGAVEVGHVIIEGGGVKLESLRSKEEETISHVRLMCERIDYYLKGSAIIATGPGKIELNNSKVEPVEKSKEEKDKKLHFDMDGPCYALAEDFKSLRWFMNEGEIIADGGDGAVLLRYVPVVEGKLGAVVRASAGYVEAGLVEMESGRSQLERLEAKGGVYYNEDEGHSFEGDSLSYEAQENLMTVGGTEARPCRVDGTEVSEIEYNLKTGKVKTRLSSRPGSVVLPQKVEN